MNKLTILSLLLCLVVIPIGCTADVKTTDDAVKVEAEGPKVEVGDETPDFDPRTDDDVDVDTPLSGDR